MQENTTSGYLKYVGYTVVGLVIFLLGISAGLSMQADQSQTPARIDEAAPQAVSLMVDYGNGKVSTFKDIPITASTTVFNVLQVALGTSTKASAGFVYKDFGGDMGVFIETINGIGKDPTGKRWWQFWVNNAYSQTGAGTYIVKPGDSIEFKFIEGQVDA